MLTKTSWIRVAFVVAGGVLAALAVKTAVTHGPWWWITCEALIAAAMLYRGLARGDKQEKRRNGAPPGTP
jgi:hypothetical protein